VPFLALPVETHKLIYTTNARFRRAVRRRGHFPNDQAALKVLYLTIREKIRNGTTPVGQVNGGNPSSTRSPSTTATGSPPTNHHAANTKFQTVPTARPGCRIVIERVAVTDTDERIWPRSRRYASLDAVPGEGSR
jgi:hypothetical protein